MYAEIILTIIAIIFLLFLLEIIKIRKLLQWNNKIVKIEPVDTRDDDELLKEAREMIISSGKASISYLQRRMRIGYNISAQIIDILEKEGVVSPPEGPGRARKVLKK